MSAWSSNMPTPRRLRRLQPSWRSCGSCSVAELTLVEAINDAFHTELGRDDSPEAYYAHTPGVKVAIPSTPADAKGLLSAAIRDPDPVIVLEPKLHYRTMRGEVPVGEHVVPLGEARVARSGDDTTIVAYGSMVPVAERSEER